MPGKPLIGTERLLTRLDKAGGQGLDLDKLPDPTNVVRSVVRSGRAHICFGRLYITRRVVSTLREEAS